jgi:hypothetical protein
MREFVVVILWSVEEGEMTECRVVRQPGASAGKCQRTPVPLIGIDIRAAGKIGTSHKWTFC